MYTYLVLPQSNLLDQLGSFQKQFQHNSIHSARQKPKVKTDKQSASASFHDKSLLPHHNETSKRKRRTIVIGISSMRRPVPKDAGNNINNYLISTLQALFQVYRSVLSK